MKNSFLEMINRDGLMANPKRLLFNIIVVAVLLRVATALYLGNTIEELPGIFDQISYHKLALRVLGGHGFSFGEAWWPATAANAPTALWSYLYTLWLTAVYAIFGPNPIIARLIQAVATGILMPWLVYRIAKSVVDDPPPRLGTHSPTANFQSAPLIAIYIYFVYYAALVTESFYIVAIFGLFDLALRTGQSQLTGLRQWLYGPNPAPAIFALHPLFVVVTVAGRHSTLL